MKWVSWLLGLCTGAFAASLEPVTPLAVPVGFVSTSTTGGPPSFMMPLQVWSLSCEAMSQVHLGSRAGPAPGESVVELVGASQSCSAETADPTAGFFSSYSARVARPPQALMRRVTMRGVYPGIDIVYQAGATGFSATWHLRSAALLTNVRFRNRQMAATFASNYLRWLPPEPVVTQGERFLRPAVTRTDPRLETEDWQWSIAVPEADPRLPLLLRFDFSVEPYGVGREGTKQDSDRNIIVAETTRSARGARCTERAGISFPCTNVAVAKFSPEGEFRFLTLLIGENADSVQAAHVDPGGNVYVLGSTRVGFPTTPGAHRRRFEGSEGFAVKLWGVNGAMIHSTLLGTENDDGISASAVDPAGQVYYNLNSTTGVNLLLRPVGCPQLAQLSVDFAVPWWERCLSGRADWMLFDPQEGLWIIQRGLKEDELTEDAPLRAPSSHAAVRTGSFGRPEFATFLPTTVQHAELAPEGGLWISVSDGSRQQLVRLRRGTAPAIDVFPEQPYGSITPTPDGGVFIWGLAGDVTPDAPLRLRCPDGGGLTLVDAQGKALFKTYLPRVPTAVYFDAGGNLVLNTPGYARRLRLDAPAAPMLACAVFDPVVAPVVKLIGRDLVPPTGALKIAFNGLPAHVLATTADTVELEVPEGLRSVAPGPNGWIEATMSIEREGALFFEGAVRLTRDLRMLTQWF